MASANTILICAARFWTHGNQVPQGFRRAIRMVARKQGVSPAELNRAEKALVKRGLLTKHRYGVTASSTVLTLTSKGVKVATRACPRVSLAPWDNAKTFAGSRRRRR